MVIAVVPTFKGITVLSWVGRLKSICNVNIDKPLGWNGTAAVIQVKADGVIWLSDLTTVIKNTTVEYATIDLIIICYRVIEYTAIDGAVSIIYWAIECTVIDSTTFDGTVHDVTICHFIMECSAIDSMPICYRSFECAAIDVEPVDYRAFECAAIDGTPICYFASKYSDI